MVAGILCTRRDLKEQSQWKAVKEPLNTELDKNLNPKGLTPIFNLCYSDLRADQKNYLFYLSIFPKGLQHKPKAVRRWI